MNDNNFIQQLADWVLNAFEGRTDRLNIVFPNKRAGLFLRQEFSHRVGKAFWLPQIFSIEEIFARWADMQQADSLTLTLDLMNFESKNSEPNHNFLSYAAQLVREFDELDHHLVDPEKLFNYLSEAKALELWHPDGSELTQYEQNYLKFYRSFPRYYGFLQEQMHRNQAASSGTIARLLAGLKPHDLIARTAEQFTIFAGFNAFSPAEEKVVLTLVENQCATLRWDLDSYYILENRFGFHEAGNSFRKLKAKSRLIPKEWMSDKLLSSAKDIYLIGSAGQIGQAKALGQILSRQSGHNSQSSTAVVLADENLLYPVLNSIPDEFGPFNVTMGLPFISTQAFGLLMSLLALENRMSRSHHPESIPINQLLEIIQNDLVFASVSLDTQAAILNFGNRLLAEGNPFIRPEKLLQTAAESYPVLSQLIGLLTGEALTYSERIHQYIRFFRFLEDQILQQPGAGAMVMATNQIIIAQRLLNQMLKIAEHYPEVQISLWGEAFLRQIASNYSMDFIGEPLEGLQLMGLLESRNLSFETVHLLSANEGILPRNTHQHSLIPFDIRKTFGLPTRNDSQSVFAFHFFHLIQNASTVYIYYNAEADAFGKSEMSRFLLQLQHELGALNPRITIHQQTFSLQAGQQVRQRNLTIQKNHHILEKIRKKMTDGLSPTSVSRYLTCPIKFYFTDILGLKEPETTETGITFRQIGIIVHRTIEQLYKPFVNQPNSVENIRSIMRQVESELRQSFCMELPGMELDEGMNRIQFLVAQRFINNLLNNDLETTQNNELTILFQEKELDSTIMTPFQQVKIKGTLDRIDRVDNQLRIIDYKTGKAELKEITITNEDEFSDPHKAKGLQLAIYIWLWLKNNPHSTCLPQGYLFSLAKSSVGLLKAILPNQSQNEAFSVVIENFLTETAGSILDPEAYFSQTSNINLCSNCSFAGICGREKKNKQWA